MRSIVNRNLTILLFLFGSISLAHAMPQSAVTASNSGWTFVQDSPVIFCTGNVTSCTISIGQITPTVAGSVWILQVQVPTHGVIITSVTGGGGMWVHCPKCHADNPNGFDADAWYNLAGNAGTYQNITFTLSASSGSFISVNFVELLPPPGFSASYDDSGTATPTNCSGSLGGTCTAVGGLNITGTDVIWQNPGGASLAAWNAWSSPYITDANGGGVALNTTSGAAPTVAFTPCGSTSSPTPCNPEFMAIAFTSTAGTFIPPTRQYSVVNYIAPSTNGGGSQNCNPSCTLTIPPTGAGHLLYLEAADQNNTYITSVSGGGTWVIPSGSNTCQISFVILSQNNAFSCAYVLSSTAGTTSLSITMSGGASTDFALFEIASTNRATFTLDTQGSHVNSSNSYEPPGQALTLTGTDDVIIQALWCVGGSLGPNYYAMPYNLQSFNYFSFNQASIAILLDSGPTPPTPIWLNPQNNATFASGYAFVAVGGSTSAPNPPTNLTVVVK